jgi:hypothetical protein
VQALGGGCACVTQGSGHLVLVWCLATMGAWNFQGGWAPLAHTCHPSYLGG